MAYGVFSTENGNLIESFRSRKRALEYVAELLDSGQIDVDEIAVVTGGRRHTGEPLSGDGLLAAAEPYRSHVAA